MPGARIVKQQAKSGGGGDGGTWTIVDQDW